MRHVVFADSAGVIRIGKRCRKGALPIGRHRHFFTSLGAVSVVARLAYDNETLLVPSVPEAKTVRAAARSPAISRLAPLYHAIGDIEAALCER